MCGVCSVCVLPVVYLSWLLTRCLDLRLLTDLLDLLVLGQAVGVLGSHRRVLLLPHDLTTNTPDRQTRTVRNTL